MRLDGVHSLQCLYERCRIDEETGCWRWSLAMSAPTEPRCFVQAGVLGEERRGVPARRVAWVLSGRKLQQNQIVYRLVSCPHGDCINPQHAAAGKCGDQLREAVKRTGNTFSSPKRLARLYAIRKKQALSAETVAEVEAALRTGEYVRDIAKRLGMNKATVSKISQGRHLHQRAGLLPGASVFSTGAK